VTIKLTVYTL